MKRRIIPAILTLAFGVLIWAVMTHTEPDVSLFDSLELTESQRALATVLAPLRTILEYPILLISFLLPSDGWFFYIAFLGAAFWGCVPYLTLRHSWPAPKKP